MVYRYLFMHLLSSSAVGTVLSQLPTYGKIQLGLGSFEVVVVLAVILISAVPSALVYSYCCAPKLGVKLIQIVVYVYVRKKRRDWLGYWL